jgi:predicted kinase
MRALFVVVSGAPGSGKSSIAKPLALALDLPVIEKDVVKEAMADVLGADSAEESKRLGAATMQVVIALARANLGAVLESTWIPELARPELASLPSPVVEVLCDVPIAVAIERYRARAGSRHAVHFDAARVDEDDWRVRAEPIDGGWPVIRVDTTRPVDIPALVAKVLAA